MKRIDNELKEASRDKHTVKKQLEEYEAKVKQLITELEQSSKSHIQELNSLHSEYRQYKVTS